MKKLMILAICILLFSMLHGYTEWKFSHHPPAKGMTERLVDWADKHPSAKRRTERLIDWINKPKN